MRHSKKYQPYAKKLLRAALMASILLQPLFLVSRHGVALAASAPPALNVDSIDSNDSSLTGTSDGSSVTVNKSGRSLGTAAVKNGTFRIPLALQPSGSALTVKATNPSGAASEKAVTVSSAPQLSVGTLYDNETVLTGTSNGSTITVYSGTGEQIATSTVNAGNGMFSISLPALSKGTSIKVTAQDAAGNDTSLNIAVKEALALTVKQLDSNDTLVSGTTNGNVVNVYNQVTNEKLGSGTASKNAFGIAIAEQKAGTVLRIATRNSSNLEKSELVTVKEAPTISVNSLDSEDTVLAGTTNAAMITVKNNSGLLIKTGAVSNGKFSIELPAQSSGAILKVTAVDAVNSDTTATVTVGKAIVLTSNVPDDNDTELSGKSGGSTVFVSNNGTTQSIASGPVSGGSFKLSIPAQAAGTVLKISTLGIMGKTKSILVTVKGAPALTLNKLDNNDTVLTGVSNGNMITVFNAKGQKIGMGLVNSGIFSVRIPAQIVGSQLKAVAQNAQKSDATAWMSIFKAPDLTVKPLASDETALMGTSSASTVTVYNNKTNAQLGSGSVSEGKFSIGLPVQAEGTVLKVVARDPAGNDTALNVTVSKGLKLTLDKVDNNDTVLTGISNGSKVTVFNNSTNQQITGGNILGGSIRLAIPPQSIGTVLKAIVKNTAGNEKSALVTVIGSPTITVDKFDGNDTVLSGTSNGSTVTAYNSSGKALTSGPVSGGRFSITVPVLTPGSSLKVKAQDAAGGDTMATMTVAKAPTLIVKPMDNDDTVLSGKTSASTVTVYNSAAQELASVSVSDGTFAVGLPAQAAGTNLKVVARDAAGNDARATVAVAAALKITVDHVDDNDNIVKGKTDGNSVSIFNSSLNKQLASGIASGGLFSLRITAQPAGTVLRIVSRNAAGNETSLLSTIKAAPALEVEQLDNEATAVKGMSNGSSVTVYDNGGNAIASGSVIGGLFNVAIPKQAVRAVLKVTAQNMEGGSTTATVTVRKH